MDYKWNCCKSQPLFKEFLGKLKDNKGHKNKDTRKKQSPWHLLLQQILNIAKLPIELAGILHLPFNKTCTSHAKKQEDNEDDPNWASELDSDAMQILELSHKTFKITMVNVLKFPMEKSRQHSRTDGLCKQKDGHSKKE